MYSTTVAASVVAAIAALPAVNAHGYVENVIIGSQVIFAGDPTWQYKTNPQQPGWFALNQDNGFVAPDEYGNADIICHKSAKPGSTSVTVAAGTTIGLQWNTWPDSHHGPVINSLAAVSGDFSAIDKTALEWFVAQEGGLISDASPPGTWATDTLIANNFTGTFTIPSTIAPGNYVLRHEIIALHSANNADGAQNYPQCINLVITGGGSAAPGNFGYIDAYSETDPGILIDIYEPIATYTIPGPSPWSGGSGGTKPTSTAAPTTMKTTTKAPSTTVAPTTTAKPTTVAPTTAKTTTTTKTTTSSAAAGSCAAKYAQCGGQGWNGPTCCAAGSTCQASGQYYSQCL